VNLEPTYLRYIYDGLINGSIHPENAAELPDGLIGMYEEAFDERTSVIERQKLLRRFAIWALLKKEVSAAFVAEVLGETEDDIQEFISTYTAWFNSPESGKYQLYHERLKVYLLQKLSEGEVHMLQEKFIGRLEQAIEEQKADEFEWYAREFLISHLAVAAMLNGDGKKLIDLAYSQTHWQRQLKISKGYSWTKNGLKEVMSWASKYNDDEVIECGLQMVDLHHQEQNAAPQIVALVAEGDFDAALKRIEQFGGSDKEGLQRKFILYMLCLMELTLLDSKDKPYRKEGIEKLLIHIDKQLPIDHSILNWNDFFSSYTLFLIACECSNLNLDFTILFKRTDDWEKEWLNELGPYSELQFQVLKDCFHCITSVKTKKKTFEGIIKEFVKQSMLDCAIEFFQSTNSYSIGSSSMYLIVNKLIQLGELDKAVKCANEISSSQTKSSAYTKLSSAYFKLGISYQANDLLNEALTCARYVKSDNGRCEALIEISSALFEQIKVKEAELVLEEAIESAMRLGKEFGDQSFALKAIYTEMAKQGKTEKALLSVRELDNNFEDKSLALYSIFAILNNQGKTEEASFVLKEAMECARNISSSEWKQSALVEISAELTKLGKIEEASALIEESVQEIKLMIGGKVNEMVRTEIINKIASLGKYKEAFECLESIPIEMQRSSALKDISKQIYVHGEIDQAIDCAHQIKNTKKKCEALLSISTGLYKQGKTEFALLVMNEIFELVGSTKDELDNEEFYNEFVNHLGIQKKFKELVHLMQESLKRSWGVSNVKERRIVLRDISMQLASNGEISQALDIARSISTIMEKGTALKVIYCKLAKKGLNKEAEDVLLESIQCARSSADYNEKSSLLKDISKEMFKLEKIDEAKTTIIESYQTAINISDDFIKNLTLKDIILELAKHGQFDEALVRAKSILDDSSRIRLIGNISTEMAKQGRKDEAASLLDDSLFEARFLDSKISKKFVILNLLLQLVHQQKLQKAIEIADGLPSLRDKYNAHASIAVALVKQGDFVKAVSIMKEILEGPRDRNFELIQRGELVNFIAELAEAGELDFAFEFAQRITESSSKSMALMIISIERVKRGDYLKAEEIGFQIPQLSQRYFCWERIGKYKLSNSNWVDATNQAFLWQNVEAKTYYLKGIASSMKIVDCDREFILSTRKFFLSDIETFEQLVQQYGLNMLFFQNANPAVINRFNHTLNFQWAIDIKNQLPN
jgi:tetratricopeptide (TPR) repeat protein